MGRLSAISPDKFTTFGALLKHLRRQAGLTQQELSIAVGYSDTQISRMEQSQRVPGQATLTAQFVPALHLEHEPEWVARLLDLAAASRATAKPEQPEPLAEAELGLPTGTVTFLFTDIAGSTRLWQRHREEMPAALARHHAILKDAIAAHSGHVFQIVGDAFCAAFAAPAEGVRAALSAQRALRDEPWGPTGSIRVRMALHSGSAPIQAGDTLAGEYGSGLTLSRAARLLSAAHGGQMLLSQAAYDLLLDQLPDGISLRDLGEHQLKDLVRRERIYEVVAPDLASEFPPLASLAVSPNNLPVQLTRFVGRDSEIAEIKRRVSDARLVTLAGPGGTGKTRLALQVVTELLPHFPDGVWLAELAPVSNLALVPLTLATALGVQEESGRPLLATLTSHLRARHLLLILDNCEHLIAACAPLAETLLQACPHLNILATSQEPLGIAGENTFLVPSLSLPAARPGLTAEELSHYESVQLFVDRAAVALPDFKLTSQNALSVAQVCLRLDGLPLAIELAAARVKLLTVEQIATRLQDRFRLLLGGSRTALPRHQTLSALIDWSYDLLSEPERALLRRLSVFAGGWTLEAAEAICAGESPDGTNVLDLSAQLVNKSLVVLHREQGREARYRLLESIRQYAKDKLLECGEEPNVRNRHLEYFLKWAEEAAPKLHGAEQANWFERLEAEHDNLRAVWEWSRVPAGEAGEAQGLRLAEALFWFWYIRNYMSEGRGWMEEALSRGAASQRGPMRAKALYAAGALGYKQADYPRARGEIEESITLFREAGPAGRRGLAYALIMLGELAEFHGDIGQSPSLFQEGVALFRELGDTWGLALALHWLGVTRDPTHPDALSLRWSSAAQAMPDDPATGRSLYEESLAIFRELGDRWAQTMPMGGLGNVAFCQGDRAKGLALFEECLAIQRELGDQLGVGWSLWALGNEALERDDYERAAALHNASAALYREMDNKQGLAGSLGDLAEVARRQGDYGQAATLIAESLTLRRELGNWERIAYALDGQGRIAWSQGDLASARALQAEALAIRREACNPISLGHSFEAFAILAAAQQQVERAAKLFGAAEPFHEALYYSLLPIWRAEHDHGVSAVRAQLGAAAFAQAWGEGQAMTADQMVAYALGEADL